MLYDWMVTATPTWSPCGLTRRIAPVQRHWHGTLRLWSPGASRQSDEYVVFRPRPARARGGATPRCMRCGPPTPGVPDRGRAACGMQAVPPGSPLPVVSPAAHPARRVDVDYAPRIRAERLIASGRVVLGAFSLLAVWLDPPTSPKYVEITNLLLAGYVTYAVGLAALAWLARAQGPRLAVATHIADLVLVCAFVYLTEGPATLIFTYFIFSVVGATLRWQWRGAVWTAAVALLAFNGIGLYEVKAMHHPAFELDRLISRSVYLVVLAGLLAFLGAYERRRRHEMSQVAAWPRTLPQDASLALRQLLKSAASVFGAPRALLAWGETDEPWLQRGGGGGGRRLRGAARSGGVFPPAGRGGAGGSNLPLLCRGGGGGRGAGARARRAASVARRADSSRARVPVRDEGGAVAVRARRMRGRAPVRAGQAQFHRRRSRAGRGRGRPPLRVPGSPAARAPAAAGRRDRGARTPLPRPARRRAAVAHRRGPEARDRAAPSGRAASNGAAATG